MRGEYSPQGERERENFCVCVQGAVEEVIPLDRKFCGQHITIDWRKEREGTLNEGEGDRKRRREGRRNMKETIRQNKSERNTAKTN